MPTWVELKEFARSKYKLSKDEENWFSLVFGYDNDRSQLVLVRMFKAFDQEWIEIGSRVCKEEEMSPRVALKKNWDFAVGALALDEQGYYVFLQRLALKDMDPDEFVLPLNVVARTADQLERDYSGKDLL